MVCLPLSIVPFNKREFIVQSPTSIDPVLSAQGGDGVSPGASRMKEMGQKAATAIDGKREAVARGIESAASALRSKTENLPVGENLIDAAYTAAEALEKAADYVREQDVKAMLSDARHTANRHPGATLLTAVAVGFLLARAFSRR
jgi:hypothetical protein